jgi:hypothetical protein
MGKKFIVLQSQKKKFRLYSEDIRTVFIKHPRKVPLIPKFPSLDKTYEEDTEEEEMVEEAPATSLSNQ